MSDAETKEQLAGLVDKLRTMAEDLEGAAAALDKVTEARDDLAVENEELLGEMKILERNQINGASLKAVREARGLVYEIHGQFPTVSSDSRVDRLRMLLEEVVDGAQR